MSDIDKYEWDVAPLEMLEMGYEVHLSRLFEATKELTEIAPAHITESNMDFCGCETCCTRETFAYLIPRVLELHAQGYIRQKSDA